jgi:hypothetical protein
MRWMRSRKTTVIMSDISMRTTRGDSSRAMSISSPVSLQSFSNKKGFNFRVGCNKLLWLANRPKKPKRGLTDFTTLTD